MHRSLQDIIDNGGFDALNDKCDLSKCWKFDLQIILCDLISKIKDRSWDPENSEQLVTEEAFEQKKTSTLKLLFQLDTLACSKSSEHHVNEMLVHEILNIDINQCFEFVKLVLVKFITQPNEAIDYILSNSAFILDEILGITRRDSGLFPYPVASMVGCMLDAGIIININTSNIFAILRSAVQADHKIRGCFSLINYVLNMAEGILNQEIYEMLCTLKDQYEEYIFKYVLDVFKYYQHDESIDSTELTLKLNGVVVQLLGKKYELDSAANLEISQDVFREMIFTRKNIITPSYSFSDQTEGSSSDVLTPSEIQKYNEVLFANDCAEQEMRSGLLFLSHLKRNHCKPENFLFVKSTLEHHFIMHSRLDVFNILNILQTFSYITDILAKYKAPPSTTLTLEQSITELNRSINH